MLALPAAAAAQGEDHRARPAGPRGTAAAPLSSTLGAPVPRFGAPFPPVGAPFPRFGAPFPPIGAPFPPVGAPFLRLGGPFSTIGLPPVGLRPPAQTNRHIRDWPFEREIEHRWRPVFYGWPVVVYYVPQPAIQIAVPASLTEPPAP